MSQLYYDFKIYVIVIIIIGGIGKYFRILSSCLGPVTIGYCFTRKAVHLLNKY